MADKAPKAKAKPRAGEKSVLATLPATRPERLGTPRGRAKTAARTRGAEPAKPRAKRVAKAKPAARHGVAAKSAPRNGAAAKPAAKVAAAKTAPRNGAAAHAGPRAVRPGSPPLRTHRASPPPKPLGAPKGRELVSTAVRATGELAQIGFMVGGHALKRAIDRIPRP